MNDVKVRELLEYRDVFQDFLDIETNWLRAQLGNGVWKNREQEVYIRIDQNMQLKEWLDNMQKRFMEHLSQEREDN